MYPYNHIKLDEEHLTFLYSFISEKGFGQSARVFRLLNEGHQILLKSQSFSHSVDHLSFVRSLFANISLHLQTQNVHSEILSDENV